MDLGRLLVELGDVAGPRPSDGASDEVWDAWVDAAEFEAMLMGMVSRPVEPRDLSLVVQLRDALGVPSLRSRLGDRLTIAEALVEALASRSAPTVWGPVPGVSDRPPAHGVFDRVAADVAVGDLALARRRLKDRVRAVPTDLTARRTLAELYRADGYPDQAGRWGALVPGLVSDEERRAFLSAVNHDPRPGRRRVPNSRPATNTLTLLGWPHGVQHPDPGIDSSLRELVSSAALEAVGDRPRSQGGWAAAVRARLGVLVGRARRSPDTADRRAEAAVRPEGQPPPPPGRCAITGVSADPARGPQPAGSGVYEFWTDREEPVRLHDTDLVSVTWEPGPRPVLTMRFVYDPGWVPADLTGRPAVLFVFGGAAVDRWSTIDEDDAMITNVDFFDWDGHRGFSLGAGITALDFSATTLDVRAVAAT